MSLKKKLLGGLLGILIVVGILISTISYQNMNRTANIYLASMSDSIMKDAYTAFNYLLTDTEYMITLISLNYDNVIEPLTNINNEVTEKSGQLNQNYLKNKRIIENFLSSMNGYKYYIVGSSVVSNKGYVFQTSHVVQNYSEIYSMLKEIDPTCKTIVMMSPIHVEGTWIKLESDYVVPAVRIIRDSKQNVIGYAILYFDYSVIESMFSNNLPKDSLFQVIDKNDNIIFSNSDNELIDFEHLGKNYVTSNYTAEKIGWKFCMAISSDTIVSNINQTTFLTLILLMLIFLVALIFVFFIISHFTNEIKELNESMKLVAEGNFNVYRHVKSNDEIGQIERMFNYMVEQVKALTERIAEEEKQKRQVEISFLQAQINPHFISNTLNVVAWMAKVYHADNIEHLTKALNTLLRAVMKQGDDVIQLRDELQHVKSYLEIMEYSGNYDFIKEFDLDEMTGNLYMLRFTLQPIVENAIYHGMTTNLERVNKLSIRAHVVGKRLQILIEDNGQGMTKKQIQSVLSGEMKKNSGINGIGIHNVQERIRLFYGNNYGIRYESEIGTYTRAIIELPIITALEKKESIG